MSTLDSLALTRIPPADEALRPPPPYSFGKVTPIQPLAPSLRLSSAL